MTLGPPGNWLWLGEELAQDDYRGLAAEFGFGQPTGVRPDRSRGGLFEEYYANLFVEDLGRRDYVRAGNGLSVVQATPMQVAKPGQPIPAEEIKALDPAKLRVKPPHLLIWGKKDTALKMSAHEGLDDLCDDLAVRYFDDADHWIIHQQPDAVAATIRDYLAG